jgi:hypothetical protein
MPTRSSLAALAASAVLLLSPSASRAGYTVTVDAPGVQASTVAGVTTETFDARSIGSYTTLNSSIGQYTATTPGFAVLGPDSYGGADQTRYMAVGAQSGQTSATLTFFAPQSYFGLYWSAVDGLNSLVVFNGATPVLTVNEGSIFALLAATGHAASYFGNPNNGQDRSEPFVYLNIFGTAGSQFTSVSFLNNGTYSEFESDNHSIASAVPEPSSIVLLGLGATALTGISLRRRFARAAKTGV